MIFEATDVTASRNLQSGCSYYHILPRIANQAQWKKNIFSKSKPKKLIFLSATFLQWAFLISWKLRVQSQMDVILMTWSSSLNMLNHIIRPIEILLDGFFFTPLLACLRSVVKRERLFLSSFNLILWSVCWHGLAASHWWPRSLDWTGLRIDIFSMPCAGCNSLG